MNDNRLDQLLRESLASEQPRPECNQTLHARMEAAQASGKAGIPMKHRRMKKTLVLAAALCAAFAVAATAYTTLVASSSGSSSQYGEFTSYSQLEQAEKKANLEINAVESFSNGYTFQQMSISHSQDKDADGNVIRKYKGIDIEYTKGDHSIFLSADPVSKNVAYADERKPVDTAVFDGITVSYYNDTYKFVPPDYELTDEDRANEKKDNYFISYGSDEVEERVMSSAYWTQDGVKYSFTSISGEVPADTLFAMAQELISAE